MLRLVDFFRRWSISKAAYPLGYSPSLDGVRGLMTLAVLGWHSGIPLLPGAATFMDVFFTMSGYLITSLLVNEYQRRGSIDVLKFYKRRVMRLFPALTLMLISLLIFSWFFSNQFEMRLIDAGVAFAYISNYWRAFSLPGLWYTAHTWSLSVEEQFYLVWPVTFIVLLRWFGISWKTVAVILLLALGFALWRAWLMSQGISIRRIYSPFETRADMLLIGCALAVALKLVDIANHSTWSKVVGWSLLPLSLLATINLLVVSETMRWYYYVSPLVAALPAVIFTTALLQGHRSFMHEAFENPVLVFCGRICYGLYIWHYPVFASMREAGFHYISVLLIGWPIVFLVAIASYYLVERHFMRSRPI